MSGKRQAASVDTKREILDVEAIASIGHGRRRRERYALAAALRGKTRKFKPCRRPAEQPPARRQRKAVRVPAQFEIAGRCAAGGGQLDARDRLPADFSPRKLREPGDNLRAPEVGEFEVDLEAFESVRVYGHPVAVRSDREQLLPVSRGSGCFGLEGAGQLRENKRRQIVEIGRAETEIAGRQRIGANGQRAGEPRRGEAEPKIVNGPAAVVVPCDMGGALERMTVDISGQGRVRVDETGYVIGERFERDAGRLAVEEPTLAQIGFECGGEIGRRAAERGGDLRLAANARIKDLGLRDLDARAEIDLLASVLPIEARGPVLSARQKVSEAKTAAGRQPRGAGHVA